METFDKDIASKGGCYYFTTTDGTRTRPPEVDESACKFKADRSSVQESGQKQQKQPEFYTSLVSACVRVLILLKSLESSYSFSTKILCELVIISANYLPPAHGQENSHTSRLLFRPSKPLLSLGITVARAEARWFTEWRFGPPYNAYRSNTA